MILFLKDLNLPKPDMYDTIQLIAFLQQLITYQGFWDHHREWIGLFLCLFLFAFVLAVFVCDCVALVGIERVQIVGSMNPGKRSVP